MGVKLKPVSEQVVVVSGADAALGSSIARALAEAGAAVVLIGRDGTAARRAAAEINQAGGRAHPLSGDATDAQEAARLARAAIARFGGFDTWINVAVNELAAGNTAREAAAHFSQGGGAVIDLYPGRRSLFGAARRRDLAAKGRVVVSEIALPKAFDPAEPSPAAVRAVLYALKHGSPRLTVVGARRLSAASEAGKHRGLLLGAGLVGLAAAAAWFGRAPLAAAAKPMLRRAATRAVARHPAMAARLAMRRPRQALGLARLALR